MASPDLLFRVRNNFYLGAYQTAINNSDISNLSQEDSIERDCIVYRSYIALGSYQETTISSLQEWLSDAAIGHNLVLRIIAGIIYMHESDYNEALKHTHTGGDIELNALNVQIFLKMHRSDYANKQLMIMQQIDEDHTVTQLANAWLNLAVGGSKIQEAYLIFEDFSERYQMTGLILNGKALCCLHMGHFEEAESLLLDALNRDMKDAETLANLIVCSLHLGKPSSRYMSQLKLSHSDHILVKRSLTAEESFERAIQILA